MSSSRITAFRSANVGAVYELNDYNTSTVPFQPIIDVATISNQPVPTTGLSVAAGTIVISTLATPITYYDFRRLFYSNNNSFHPKYYPNMRSFTVNTSLSPVDNLLSSPDVSYADTPLNLYNKVITAYNDVLVDCSNFNACFLTAVQKEIGSQQTILDIDDCNSTSCSLTLNEFFNAIEATGTPFDFNGPEAIDTWLPVSKHVTAVVTTKYYPPTKYLHENLPCVDVVRNYMIDFTNATSRAEPTATHVAINETVV